MTLILGGDRIVWDCSKPKVRKATITAGEHRVEVIPDPFGKDKNEWIVKKGTMIGAPKLWWDYLRCLSNPCFDTRSIIIIK